MKRPMLTRSEYEQIIQVFFVELNHLCLHETDNDLRSLPQLAPEIDNYLTDLRDSTNDASQSLYNAFAYLDEYRGANWDKVAAAGYEAYRISQSRSGLE
jgi:hypothetical protein